MVSFTANKIFLDSETTSEKLKKTREEKKLSTKEVAAKLNIKLEYLEALENHEFWRLPKGVYGKNFLREYAIFLDLNYKEMTEAFEKETEVERKEKEQQLFSAQVVKNSYFLALPKMFRNGMIVAVILVCFTYLGLRMSKIASPPLLIISSPGENLITGEKTVDVGGVTEAETQLLINGEMILSDTNGLFQKNVDLKNGVNIITITAKKKYGRASTIQRQILVKETDFQL